MESLFDSANYIASRRLLDAAVLRHQAIAANLANLETPNYRRVDLAPDFRTSLREALRHQDGPGLSTLRPTVAGDSSAVSRRPDGNTVNLASELLAMQENSFEHAVQVQLVSGRLARLRSAISGRVS